MTTEVTTGHHAQFNEQDYHDIDAVSSGRLRNIAMSPAEVQEQLANFKQTEATRIGSALHVVILEPTTWKHRYCVGKITSHKGKANTAFIEAAEKDGLSCLTDEEFERVQGMSKSVLSHPRISTLLVSANAAEETTFWMRDGELCKSRKDLVGDGWIADLKTTIDFHRFNYDVTQRRLYIQAAHYTDGDRRHGRIVAHWFWIVVQSKPPYLSGIKRLTDIALLDGFEEMEKLLTQYLECRRANRWSNHVEEIDDVSIARWRVAEIYPEEG